MPIVLLSSAASSRSMVEAFFRALSVRDLATAAHCQRVSVLAAHLALAAGLVGADVTIVRQAALLHDLGKIGVDDRVLRKPAELTGVERLEMERHPVLGLEILGPLLPELHTGIRSHHEAWTGGGYPDALAGETIPLVARIIAVCDAYDAMIEDRVYRRGRPPAEALRILRDYAGVQWQRDLVQLFVGEVAARTQALRRAA